MAEIVPSPTIEKALPSPLSVENKADALERLVLEMVEWLDVDTVFSKGWNGGHCHWCGAQKPYLTEEQIRNNEGSLDSMHEPNCELLRWLLEAQLFTGRRLPLPRFSERVVAAISAFSL